MHFLFTICSMKKLLTINLISILIIGLSINWSNASVGNNLEVSIKSSNPIFKCRGDETTLSTVNTYTSYQWSTGETTATIWVTRPGYYSVIVTDGAGCTGTSSRFRLTGKGNGEKKSEIEDVYGKKSLCPGETVTLVGSRDSNNRFNWSTGDTTSFITVSESASVYLVLIDDGGCELKPSETVHIDMFSATQPTIAIDGPTVFCNENDATTLTATYDTNYDFSWSNGAVNSSILLDAPGSYFCTSKNDAGCEVKSSPITIQAVNQSIPQLSSGGDLILCDNETLDLITGSSAFAYAWSTGETGTKITVSEGGSYSLNLIDANNCKSVPASIEVQKPVLMIPEIIYSGSLTFCDGSALVLSANVNPFYLWQWPNGSHTIDTAVTQSGTFFISGIDQLSGCRVNSDTVVVRVGEIEDPTISLIGSAVLCKGDSVVLQASPSAEYYWLGPNTDEIDNRQPTLVLHQGGVYELAVVNDFGCVASSEPIEIFLDTLANDPVIYGGRDFEINTFKTYHTRTIPETNVTWSIKGGQIDFPNRDTITVYWESLEDAELCLQYTSSKGCASKMVCLNDEVGIYAYDENLFDVFPNPAENQLKIKTPFTGSLKMIEIYDDSGKLVLEQVWNKDIIDVSSLTPGIHICILKTDGQGYFKKFSKQ